MSVKENSAGKPASPRPRKAERYAEILKSARKVFAERGYERASMAEIARGAGVVEGTIYQYFEGKQDLLYKILLDHYDGIIMDIERTLPGIRGTENRLRYIIRRALQALCDDRPISLLIIRELRPHDDYYQSVVHDLNRRYAAFLTGILKEGIEEGCFRADLSLNVVRDMVYGGLEHIAWASITTGRSLDIESVAEDTAQTVLAGIVKRPETAEGLSALISKLETLAADLKSSTAAEDR